MAKKGNPEVLKKITADAKRIRNAAGTKEKTVKEYSMSWKTAVKQAAKKYNSSKPAAKKK